MLKVSSLHRTRTSASAENIRCDNLWCPIFRWKYSTPNLYFRHRICHNESKQRKLVEASISKSIPCSFLKIENGKQNPRSQSRLFPFCFPFSDKNRSLIFIAQFSTFWCWHFRHRKFSVLKVQIRRWIFPPGNWTPQIVTPNIFGGGRRPRS